MAKLKVKITLKATAHKDESNLAPVTTTDDQLIVQLSRETIEAQLKYEEFLRLDTVESGTIMISCDTIARVVINEDEKL